MTVTAMNQILLLLVITVLGTVLTLAGIEVIKILKDFRHSLQKLNQILDEVHLISSSISKPVAGFSNFLTGLKNGAEVMGLLLTALKRKEKDA